MERLVIAKNQTMARDTARNWETTKNAIQEAVDAFDRIEGVDKLEPGEFGRIFTDTDRLLFEKLTGGAAHLSTASGGSISVKADVALGLIDKPEGYDDFREAIASTLNQMTQSSQSHRYKIWKKDGSDIVNFFYLDSEGQVQYKDNTQKLIDEAGEYALKTEHGQAQYKFVQDVVKAFYDNRMHEYYRHQPNAMQGIVDTLQLVIKEMDYSNKSFTQRPEPEIIVNRLDTPGIMA